MQRSIVLFVGLAMILLVNLHAAVAADAPKPVASPKEAIKGDYAILVQELKLSEDQQVKLGEKIIAMQDALAAWDAKNSARITLLQTDLKAAEQAKDQAQQKSLTNQLQLLQDERYAVQNQWRQVIFDMLTSEQKLEWSGISLYLQSDYPAMARQLNFTPAQEAVLKERVKKYGITLAKWDQENSPKMRELEQQINNAQATLDSLKEQRAMLVSETRGFITDVFTPEQRTAWAVIKLQQYIAARYQKIKLTDAQNASLKDLCTATGKDISQLPENDLQGRSQLIEKLYQTINEKVLTEAQRTELNK